MRPRSYAFRIDLNAAGTSARGVSYLEKVGKVRRERGDLVIGATSAIETARLLLASATDNPAHRGVWATGRGSSERI